MAEESPETPKTSRDLSRLPLINDTEEPVKDSEDHSYTERTEYETAKKKTIEAEARRSREEERREGRSRMREGWAKFRHKKPAVILLVVVVLFIGVTLYIQHQKNVDTTPEPRITATSDLEGTMKVGYLSTLKYDYHGIAEHHDVKKVFDFVVSDTVDYRVKYTATFRVYYDLESVKFKKGEDGTFTAYLPDPQIGEPVVATNGLGYLPDTASPDPSEVYDLCMQDASEVDTSEMATYAESGLEDTVQALAAPLLTDDEGTHKLKFDRLANYSAGEATDNAAE